MIKIKPASFVAIGTLVAAWLLLTFVLSETGQVMDRVSGKPLANVFVIAEWNGTLGIPLHARSTCYDAVFTVTDSEGRYRLPDFSWNFNPYLRNRQRAVYPYKPGYKESSIRGANENVMFMEPRVGSKAEMFHDVESRHLSGGCDESRSRFSVPRKIRAKELESLAESVKEVNIANGVLFALESDEIGDAAAARNNRRREVDGTQLAAGEWKVVDSQNGAPVPDAWITIEYTYDTFGYPHAREACSRVDVMMSGPDGRFIVPKLPTKGSGAPHIAKAGYKRDLRYANRVPGEVYLVPFIGTREEDATQALEEAVRGQCSDDESISKLLPKRRAFLVHALELADSLEQNHAGQVQAAQRLLLEQEGRVTRK
jgi:hypothetical protein